MAYLIEHYAGVFPVWLSPVQIKIISVGSDHKDYSHSLKEKFAELNIRSEVDDLNETVGNKIRKATQEKIPYMLVIGDKEMKEEILNVRKRGDKKVSEVAQDKFIETVQRDIKDRKIW